MAVAAERPVAGRAGDGGRGLCVSRFALLVDREREDAFRAALVPLAERLAPQGVSLEVSGPRAP